MEYNYKDFDNHLEELLNDLKRLLEVADVSVSGLKVAQMMPQFSKIIKALKHDINAEQHLDVIKRAEIAKVEVDAGFPFLYTQSILMMYAYLEGTVKRCIISFFMNNDLTRIKELNTIKISFGEYVSLDESEKFDYLFQQYEKAIAAGMMYGVTRFENLLSPIKFSGKVNEDISKDIFELSQIRNTILHRGGIVDRHFANHCHWLGYKKGDKIVINFDLHKKYADAVIEYTKILIYRLFEFHNYKPKK